MATHRPDGEMDDAARLALWDACTACPPRSRAHRLAAFGAGRDVREVPLGHWQAGLSAAWRHLGADAVEAVVDCPRCGDRLEVALPAEVLPAAGPVAGTTTVEWRDRLVEIRLPTARDVEEAAGSVQRLSRLCQGDAGADDAVPTDVLAEALQAADPLALLTLALTCPTCGESFEEPLDLAVFVWAALEDRALALLRQVAVLAAAYGWSEADILALSPGRRAVYEELIGR